MFDMRRREFISLLGRGGVAAGRARPAAGILFGERCIDLLFQVFQFLAG